MPTPFVPYEIDQDSVQAILDKTRIDYKFQGYSPDNPLPEAAPGTTGARLSGKNFSTPEAMYADLRQRFGPENVKPEQDKGPYHFAIRGDDGMWRPIDPGFFESFKPFSLDSYKEVALDVADLGGDIVEAGTSAIAGLGGGMVGGPAGAIAAAGGAAGATRAALLGLGGAAGYENTQGLGREIGISTAAGALGETLGLALYGKGSLKAGAKRLYGYGATRAGADAASEPVEALAQKALVGNPPPDQRLLGYTPQLPPPGSGARPAPGAPSPGYEWKPSWSPGSPTPTGRAPTPGYQWNPSWGAQPPGVSPEVADILARGLGPHPAEEAPGVLARGGRTLDPLRDPLGPPPAPLPPVTPRTRPPASQDYGIVTPREIDTLGRRSMDDMTRRQLAGENITDPMADSPMLQASLKKDSLEEINAMRRAQKKAQAFVTEGDLEGGVRANELRARLATNPTDPLADSPMLQASLKKDSLEEINAKRRAQKKAQAFVTEGDIDKGIDANLHTTKYPYDFPPGSDPRKAKEVFTGPEKYVDPDDVPFGGGGTPNPDMDPDKIARESLQSKFDKWVGDVDAAQRASPAAPQDFIRELQLERLSKDIRMSPALKAALSQTDEMGMAQVNHAIRGAGGGGKHTIDFEGLGYFARAVDEDVYLDSSGVLRLASDPAYAGERLHTWAYTEGSLGYKAARKTRDEALASAKLAPKNLKAKYAQEFEQADDAFKVAAEKFRSVGGEPPRLRETGTGRLRGGTSGKTKLVDPLLKEADKARETLDSVDPSKLWTDDAAAPKPSIAGDESLAKEAFSGVSESGQDYADLFRNASYTPYTDEVFMATNKETGESFRFISSPALRTPEDFHRMLKADPDKVREALTYWSNKNHSKTPVKKLGELIDKYSPDMISGKMPKRRAELLKQGKRNFWNLDSPKNKKWKLVKLDDWDIRQISSTGEPPVRDFHRNVTGEYGTISEDTLRGFRNMGGTADNVRPMSQTEIPVRPVEDVATGAGDTLREEAAQRATAEDLSAWAKGFETPETSDAGQGLHSLGQMLSEGAEGLLQGPLRNDAVRLLAFMSGHGAALLGTYGGAYLARSAGRILMKQPRILVRAVQLTKGATQQKMIGALNMLQENKAMAFQASLHVLLQDAQAAEAIKNAMEQSVGEQGFAPKGP